MKLADLVRRKRAQYALSQQQMADACGLSKNAIYKIEDDRGNNVMVENVIALAKAMKVTPEVVLYAAMEGISAERGIDVTKWIGS